eukprot:45867-Prymnesium_polylepis.2
MPTTPTTHAAGGMAAAAVAKAVHAACGGACAAADAAGGGAQPAIERVNTPRLLFAMSAEGASATRAQGGVPAKGPPPPVVGAAATAEGSGVGIPLKVASPRPADDDATRPHRAVPEVARYRL